jgi:hypothetical protein
MASKQRQPRWHFSDCRRLTENAAVSASAIQGYYLVDLAGNFACAEILPINPPSGAATGGDRGGGPSGAFRTRGTTVLSTLAALGVIFTGRYPYVL